MNDALISFIEQFRFEPHLEGAPPRRHLLAMVGGMGGSHLAAGLLNAIDPSLSIFIHRDYGLPELSLHLACETLFIASSYSGNTEETLSFAETAHTRGLPLAVVTSGGKLATFAREKKISLILLPQTSLPPRMTVGMGALGITELLGKKELQKELAGLSKTLNPQQSLESGKSLAHELVKKVPLIYSSEKNGPLGYYWKVTLNETAKMAAFCNQLPEADHNEIESFDGGKSVLPAHVLFLTDGEDHPRVQLRMRLTEDLYAKRNIPTTRIELQGKNRAEKIFGSVLLANATAEALARSAGTEALRTPLIEQLKQKLQR